MERLPYPHDPGWGAAAFSSLLAAAARFQVFAAAVDTDLVFARPSRRSGASH